jgi:hypothetical protein
VNGRGMGGDDDAAASSPSSACRAPPAAHTMISVSIRVPSDSCNALSLKDTRLLSSPLMPKLVVPCATAARACSICTSFPLGEKVVNENLCPSHRQLVQSWDEGRWD